MTQLADTTTRSKIGTWISKLATDALLLGGLSAFGYAVAFVYEAGYASHFGYGTYLISPTTAVIVPALGGVFFFAFGFIPMIFQAFDSDHSARAAVRRFFEKIVVAVSCLYPLVTNNFEPAGVLGAGAVLAAFWFIKHHLYPNLGVMHKIGLDVLFVGLAVFSLATAMGARAAAFQTAFLFLESPSDYAVVRIYNDVAIAVRYDAEKQVFTEEYAAIKLGDQKSELKLVRRPVVGQRKLVVVDPPISEWMARMRWSELRALLTPRAP